MMAATDVVMVSRGDATPKTQFITKVWKLCCTGRATTFNGVGTSTISGKLELPMAVKIRGIWSHRSRLREHP